MDATGSQFSTSLSAEAISQLDLTRPLPSVPPKHPKKQNKRKRIGAQNAKPTPEPSSTLHILKLTALEAVKAIPKRSIKLPHLTKDDFSNIPTRRQGDLADLGKSHLSFAVVVLLRERLPVHVLSRGSLTVIRESVIARTNIETLKARFIISPDTSSRAEITTIYSALGILAEQESAPGVKKYLANAFETFFATVCSRGLQLDSLQLGKEYGLEDETTEVLRRIQSNDEVVANLARKRRYSPGTAGKENQGLLAVPSSPKTALKRRKSVHDTPDALGNLGNVTVVQDTSAPVDVPAALPLLQVPITSGRRRSFNGVTVAEREAISVEPLVVVHPAPSEDASEANEEYGSSINTLLSNTNPTVGPSVMEREGSPGSGCVPLTSEVEKLHQDAGPLVVQPSPPKDQGCDEQDDERTTGEHEIGKEAPSLRQCIQNAIIVASLDPNFQPTFPPISLAEIWLLALGGSDIRDPLETCGDAAMHTGMTEVLIQRLKASIRGTRLRRGIISPLVSNATFFYFLLAAKKVLFDADGSDPLPKYPGNSLEVFAAMLALYQNLEDLKTWITTEFEAIIAAAEKAWNDCYPEPPSVELGSNNMLSADSQTDKRKAVQGKGHKSSQGPNKRAKVVDDKTPSLPPNTRSRVGRAQDPKGKQKADSVLGSLPTQGHSIATGSGPSQKRQVEDAEDRHDLRSTELCAPSTKFTFCVPKLTTAPNAASGSEPVKHNELVFDPFAFL
ncbi:hypothetical protein B0H11DRAFT_355923 [Mycena galericulata]|nr:hypothetical protein B0H11DRAFT_355923 [Mycena galericulata]